MSTRTISIDGQRYIVVDQSATGGLFQAQSEFPGYENLPRITVHDHNGNLAAELNDIMAACGRLCETLCSIQSADMVGDRQTVLYYGTTVLLETKDFIKKVLKVFYGRRYRHYAAVA